MREDEEGAIPGDSREDEEEGEGVVAALDTVGDDREENGEGDGDVGDSIEGGNRADDDEADDG